MLIDLLGQSKRGVAVGILECSIYVSVAIWTFIGVQLAEIFGYQPVPFSTGAVLAVLGSILSFIAKDTLKFVSFEKKIEQKLQSDEIIELQPMINEEGEIKDEEIDNIVIESSWLSKKRIWFCFKEKSHDYVLSYSSVILNCFINRQISLCIFAGVVNNVKDGLAWVVFPLYFSDDWGVDDWTISILMLVYPLSWGVLQLFTGIN